MENTEQKHVDLIGYDSDAASPRIKGVTLELDDTPLLTYGLSAMRRL